MTDDFATLGEWRDDPPMVGALITPVDGEDRVLLQLRDYNTVRYTGCWGFFGGKVEEGESLGAAAVREFEEEAGLTLAPADLTPRFRMTSPETGSNLYIFEAAINAGPADIRLGEGAGFAFIGARHFGRLDLASITRTVLQAWLTLPHA